jgi:hypothetical protein
VLLGIRQSRENQNTSGAKTVDEMGKVIDSLLDAEVQVQQDDIRPAKSRVRQGLACGLRFPHHDHSCAVFNKHAETRPNNGVVVDDADFDCFHFRSARVALRLRDGVLVCSLGHLERLYIH